MDKDKTNEDEENIPIDGQIGIEDLYVPENKEEEMPVEQPIDGQISFDEFSKKTQKNTKQEIEEKDLKTNNQKTNKNENKKEKVFKKTEKTQNIKKPVSNIEKPLKVKEIKPTKKSLTLQIQTQKSQKNEAKVVGQKIRTEINERTKSTTKYNTEECAKKTDKQENKLKNLKNQKNIDFVENEENSTILRDLNNINSGFEEVKLKVGRDVFGNDEEEDNTVKAEKVKETDISEINEKTFSENSGEDVVDGMLYKTIDKVLHESMIPYSEHVILDRALPRVEDGLKPVQRRILYSMMELGVTPDKPFRKSARIVGDCLGKYHPHGDRSVYDAMVRMAQPFNTNVLLVNGHGNFGSVDGDGAAAMRYTEARLAPLAMELLRDLDKNTVKWMLNFDDTLKEPEILPGRYPNILVNGSTGIAVGLATNIPPHNLGEVIDGVVSYILNPNITLKEMLKIIKGPDFPTGGYILNSSEIKQAYETGRGKIYMRAKMHIESNDNDKKYIVITEFPYQVNKANLLQKIASLKEENKYDLGGISEVRDESDREGIRAVVRIKKDADIKKIYLSLLKNTELQTTFGINMVAIANGKPKQMGLMDIISYYVEYQREIIFRRSKYDLEQAKEREHILSGLIIAIKNIDEVVKIIKKSENTTEAKKHLRDKFNLSEKQAQAILDMRLARLTSLEVYKLEEELKKLKELIKSLTAIINSKKLQLELVKDEILQIKKLYREERKTKLLKVDDSIEFSSEEKPTNQPVVIFKNALNNFKCVAQKQYNLAQKDFKENSTLYEVHTLKFETESSKSILAFSNFGNCFKIDVKDFSESRYKDKGISENVYFKNLKTDETVVALFDYEQTLSKDNLIFLTKFGMIKKTALSEYSLLKSTFQAIKLKENDEVLKVLLEPKNYSFVFVTKSGMVLNAENKDVPVQGRISGGVRGINLSDKDFCVGVDLAQDEGEIVVVSDKGFSKRVLIANIDKMVRYRKGLKIISLAGENGKDLIYAGLVKEPFTINFVDKEETLFFKNTDLIPIETRIGKGKLIDKSKKKIDLKNVFNCLI